MDKEYSLFRKLDVFGTEYSFLIDGKRNYKTPMGALITLFYIFLVVALFFAFGIDLYQRKNPKVSLNSQNFPYKPVKLSNLNFTYAYRVEDADGIMQTDESIIKMKVNFYSYELINGSWVTSFKSSRAPQRCHDFPEYEEKENKYNISLQSWYCVDFNNYSWGGFWDANFVNYFEITVNVCMNSTSDITCAKQEKISKQFYSDISGGNLYFSDLSLYVEPALTNYNNPISTTLVNRYQMLNLDITKSKVQTYKITEIDNDVGWFFEDFLHESVINVDNILNDFTFKDRWKESVLFYTVHYMGRKVETYRRSYTKIQEVFASIGGFSKFFFTLLVLLFSNIRSVYNSLLLINSIPFYEDPLRDSNSMLYNEVSKSIMTDNFISQSRNIKYKIEKKQSDPPKKTDFNYYDYFCYSNCKKKGKSGLAYNKLENYKKYEAFFQKKLDISSYFDIHHKFYLMKKILLSKDDRYMIKFIKPKLKEVSTNFKNYFEIYEKLFQALQSNNIQPNSSVNLDGKKKILIEMMEENVRKYFE